MPDTNFYDIKSRSDTVKDVWLNVRLKEQGITTKEWKALHRSGRPLSMYRRIMDKRKGAQNVSDAGMTLLDLYVMRAKEIGFPVTVNPSYDDGNRIDHQIIREAMDYELFTGDDDENVELLVKRPKWYVLRDCINTIYCYEHYSYDDYRNQAAENRALSERVKDRYKDYVDLDRYMLGENITWERARVVPSRNNEGDRYRQRQDAGRVRSWKSL
jgi:hypothetical protein